MVTFDGGKCTAAVPAVDFVVSTSVELAEDGAFPGLPVFGRLAPAEIRAAALGSTPPRGVYAHPLLLLLFVLLLLLLFLLLHYTLWRRARRFPSVGWRCQRALA